MYKEVEIASCGVKESSVAMINKSKLLEKNDISSQPQIQSRRSPRSKLLLATKVESNLVVMRSKALFDTRFSPDVNELIIALLLENMNLPSMVYPGLRTEQLGHNTFHVSDSETEFDRIGKPEVWPAGLSITLVRSKLKE